MVKGSPYVAVRALVRGLRLLSELALRGRSRPAELAEATGIDRATIYRLLETLRAEGYVALGEGDGRYGLTVAVRQLGEGFTELDQIRQVVAPELGRLLTQVLWPSDFASFELGGMVIRESTHRFSPFSVHRSMVGRVRSLTRSSLGQAALAAASPRERGLMLELAVATGQPDAGEAADTGRIATVVAEVMERGYAWSIDGSEAGISAIAVPIRLRLGVIAALNTIFFTSAMTPQEAARRYLAPMRETAAAIERGLAAAGTPPEGEPPPFLPG